MKIKNKLIFLIIVASGLLSFFYSREIYTFYMRTYYEKIKGKTLKDLVKRADDLFKNGEYEKLRDYIRTLVIIYPDNSELKKIEGMNFIKLGEKRRGADIILSSMNGEKIPAKVLEETIYSLFEQKLYNDIIYTLKKNDPGNNSNILFYYGASLFKTGEYGGAIEKLKEAMEEGRTDYIIYHYIGMAYERSGNNKKALEYLEQAKEMNYYNSAINKSLVNIYRKLGRFDDAVMILRKQKRNFKRR